MTEEIRPESLIWRDGCIHAVDQVALPHHFRRIRVTSVRQLVTSIRRLVIRGAPSLAAAGALGVLLSANAHLRRGALDESGVRADAEELASARPTAVNLRWAVQRMLAVLDEGIEALEDEAARVLDEISSANLALASATAEFAAAIAGTRPVRALTHCNTGWLATQTYGTALGAITRLHADGKLEHAYCCETRPLLQGARLTCWELGQAGAPHSLLIDSAAASAMSQGKVDCVLVGADRIAANGDTANKVGTLQLAIAARHYGIPFVVAAPESTIDRRLASGQDVPIEQRAPEEVVHLGIDLMATRATAVENPAFDVTPSELITAIITEIGEYRGRPG